MASILLIYQHYLGKDDPGFSRFNEYAKRWVAEGHSLTVIAGQVNYLTGVRPGKYKGRWAVVENGTKGIRVFRAYTSDQYSKSFIGRAWSYLSFMIAAASVVPFIGKCDVILVSSPPLTVAVPGWFASIWHRAPHIFEIRDLWPESAISTGVLQQHSLLTRILEIIERLAYRRATRINVLTPAYIHNIKDRGLAPEEKFVFVPNGVDASDFKPNSEAGAVWRKKLGWQDKFVVLYAGAHGLANNLFQLIEAAKLLRHNKKILIATVGDGMYLKQLRTAAAELQLENIQFLGPISKTNMSDLLNASDVCTAVLQRNDTFRTVYPNKMFEYMACGKPIILGIDGVARELLDRAKAGLYAAPEEPEQFVAAALKLQQDPELCDVLGKQGRVFVEQHFNRDVLAKRTLQVLLEQIT